MAEKFKKFSAKSFNGVLNVDMSLEWDKRFTGKWDDIMHIVQSAVDNECIRQMTPYVPMLTRTLAKSVLINSVIGSGKLTYAGPYARYLYYGEVYGPNIPIIENEVLIGFFSPPKKEPTGLQLQYNKTFHPLAGKLWFERMKSDHLEDIRRAGQDAANAALGRR